MFENRMMQYVEITTNKRKRFKAMASQGRLKRKAREEWFTTFPHMRKVDDDGHHVRCDLCKSELTSEISTIKKHWVSEILENNNYAA